MSDAKYDIFLSYAESDKENALKLRGALLNQGLAVYSDEERTASYDCILNILNEGLSLSKALLAYYSREYSRSRTCQWEITQAFIAGEKEARASEAIALSRIIIVNPERSKKHIFPEEFGKAFSARLPEDASDKACEKVAAGVGKQISKITNPIGEVIALDKPSWYRRAGTFHPSFTGRVNEIWNIHCALRNGGTVLLTGAKDEPHGLLGIGKSILAEEYAMRFGAAYPGGVYWISAAAPPPRIRARRSGRRAPGRYGRSPRASPPHAWARSGSGRSHARPAP